ncbi:DUF2283 domain-containing protein [Lamprocystis purpurea]|jgi:uncharacterized protein YuzE|uniref:DUF2283 domain-containing protein n=1 Tax=Lamprocystis purpurea TaxID=61598 RepID=UPI00037E1664|nr:DUF2283 domain-containing protein [Lamprocystis purpurea]MBV5347121.1 DUF2283 domain-containing protein [bacterium]
MTHTKITYFEDVDTLHLSIADDAEAGSVEISPDVTAELNADGELIGVEIINASSYLRDKILESAQARLLQLSKKVA